MNFFMVFETAIKNILKNKMRSFLTALGIIIGIASVIIMVGVGEGSKQQIESQISDLGTNLLMVRPVWRGARGSTGQSFQRLTDSDYRKIMEEVPDIAFGSPMVMSTFQLVAGNKNWGTSVQGVSDEIEYIRGYRVSDGEFFSQADVNARRKVAVIGETVAKELFEGADPIGETIRIRAVPFMVVGVLESKGASFGGTDNDDVVFVPYSTFLQKFRGNKYIQQIYLSTYTQDTFDSVSEEIAVVLRREHRIKEGADDDFTVGSQVEIAEMATTVTKTMTLLLGAIAGVSLLVGGIGVMNIMMVSVSERTREIGIRMAIGAKEGDILKQFLVEALVLSFAGGLMGILLSVIVAFFLNSFTSFALVIQFSVMLIAALFTAAIGVFFGYYPAKKAAKLNPIDALRYE